MSSELHQLLPPTVNFLILIGLLFYCLRKPVKTMIVSRQSAIKSQIEEARIQKAEAEKRYREFNDRLTTFESEAKRVLDNAHVEADALKNRIIAEANATAARIVRDAEATAEANAQEYKDQIRRETIAQAVALAERTIRESLSKDDQRRIVTEYVGKVQ